MYTYTQAYLQPPPENLVSVAASTPFQKVGLAGLHSWRLWALSDDTRRFPLTLGNRSLKPNHFLFNSLPDRSFEELEKSLGTKAKPLRQAGLKVLRKYSDQPGENALPLPTPQYLFHHQNHHPKQPVHSCFKHLMAKN